MSENVYSILQFVTTTLQGVGIILTIFRLWYRVSIRRFWWEDAWAAAALLFSFAYLISYWVHKKAPHNPSIVAFWVYTFAFPCVVWAVRMSVLYSVTRLVHPLRNARRIARSVTVLFVFLWGGIVVWKGIACGTNLTWYNSPTVSCSGVMPRSMDLYEFCTDVISDAILVALPFRMLWQVKLPQNRQRHMILLIFSSGIIVTIASLFRALCRIMGQVMLTSTATDFEIAACLIVCNLLVVVTYIYRIFRKSEPEDESDSEFDDRTPVTSPVFALNYLTTVELDNLDEYGTQGSQVGTTTTGSKIFQPSSQIDSDISPVFPDVIKQQTIKS